MTKTTPITFSSEFLFGVSNAPGQVEDNLNDIWLDFGREGRLSAFLNQDLPEERLRFWTEPETEIDLAADLGVQVFRLGVDWGRIHPQPGQFDQDALNRYREILELIRAKNMKVMLTLFHFSLPQWVQRDGGWPNPKTKDHFFSFSQKVMAELGPLVDFWITFNEPQIFGTMAYTLGIFPPGKKGSVFRCLTALKEMVRAHKAVYSWAHANLENPVIGIAQHMGLHSGKSPVNKFISRFTGEFMNWYFPKRITGHMDYFGFNYYGAEWISGAAISVDDEEEYSEAGRAIYPRGLYHISKEINHRFPGLPQFITENGVSDATDLLRPSYLIQHLKVVSRLISEKIKILGYIHWTLSDNLEWSDGYGPRFGLVAVDRTKNLARTKRPSFFLYQKIIRERVITVESQDSCWAQLQAEVGTPRPFWRADDGKTGLNESKPRLIRPIDWRF